MVCEYDVGSLVWEEIVGLEAFNERNIWREVRWVDAWGTCMGVASVG